jgi:glycyl-tRNA synthetase alpha subunit
MCIKEIFTFLKENGPQSMQNICNELGFGWEQLDTYLQLIQYIQEEATLVDNKLGAKTRILYLKNNNQ